MAMTEGLIGAAALALVGAALCCQCLADCLTGCRPVWRRLCTTTLACQAARHRSHGTGLAWGEPLGRICINNEQKAREGGWLKTGLRTNTK